jgi:porin
MIANSKALLLAALLGLGSQPAWAETSADQFADDLTISDDIAITSCVESCDDCAVDCGCACGDACGGGSLMDALNLDVVYTGDTFANTRGGIDTGTNYGGLLDVVLYTDLAALGLEPIGGTFVLHGQNKHGPSLTRLVGATQSINTDADPFTAMAEYYWQRPMFDDLIVWRIGRQVGAIQFSVLDLAADFTYGAFQKSPNNPIPWYPNPSVAATVAAKVTESIDFNYGAFNGAAPDQLSPWGWSEEGKVYNVAQLKYHYSWGGLPGDLQTGAWYESGSHDAVVGPGTFHGNNGYYFGWDQLLVNEQENSDQGLGTFCIYSYAPDDRNIVRNHFATGVVYRGLLPGRDGDVIGVGCSWAEFSDDLVGRETEQTTEAFYNIHLTETLIVQPAMHYIDNPGGTLPDALTAGFRFGFEL